MSIFRAALQATALCLLVALLVPGLAGTSLQPLNLQDMARMSPRIFEATCLSSTQGVDQRGLPFTSYTFRVTDAIQGASNGQTVTVRQFGLRDVSANRFGGLVLSVPDMPHYLHGQRYLLFLPQQSRWGFAAPIGLAQGAFRILGKGKERMAINGVGNLNLALDTSQSLDQRLSVRRAGRGLHPVQGPVAYSALRSTLVEVLSGRRMSAQQLAQRLKGGSR